MSQLVRFVLVAVVVCNGFGNVLCFGSDGHVAIEPVFHDHCDHDHHHYQHSGTSHRQDADGQFTPSCRPCEDVVIVSDLAPARSQNFTQSIFVYSGINLTVDPVSYTQICQRGVADSFSYFTPLKTIILLT